MNILTFDLEDWFHILDHPEVSTPQTWERMESRIEKNTERILSLLESKNIKATWFCLGWIAKKYPSLIKRISENHEIGCHSMEHTLLFKMKPDDFRKDINANIKVLEDTCGRSVDTYRAPGFSFTIRTKWAVEILAEAGIKYDCSVFPMKRNHGGFDSFPSATPCRISNGLSELREFPMNISSFAFRRVVFSGGGYFRLLPYPVISSLMNKSAYVMTYFHPRDFDAGQPVIKSLSLKRKFMSYTGLKNSFSRFNRLLNDYKFVSVNEASEIINWSETPLIKLDEIKDE